MPGDPEASELIYRIFADDPEEHMPPPETRAPLTAAQKEIIRRWIAEGADYSDRPFLPLDPSGSVCSRLHHLEPTPPTSQPLQGLPRPPPPRIR